MLDGLLARGFSSKCKSSIKLVRCRIEIVKRKRNAMIRFFKKDIADLLKSGLDQNAYGRAEGLIIEMKLSSCYDLIDDFCASVLKHLSLMQKERECPKECREAVGSLMFAAARFADLPELRELRSIFTERFGNTLASFVNREFAEKLASEPPSMDQKLHLLQEIAKEFSINWDSKASIQKISNPPVSAWDQPNKSEPLNHGKHEKSATMDKKDDSSHGEQERNLGNRQTTGEDVKDSTHTYSVKSENDRRQFGINISNKKESSEYVKPHYNNMNPPYVKARRGKHGTNTSDIPDSDSVAKGLPDKSTNDSTQEELAHNGQGTQVLDQAGFNRDDEGKGQDDSVVDSKPKPRSVRRRPVKPAANDNDANAAGIEDDSSSSSNVQKAYAEQGTMPMSIFGQVEKFKERLFMRYNNKTLNNESTKPTAGGLNSPTDHVADASESLSSRKNDTSSNLNLSLPFSRADSLPTETMVTEKVAKVHVRAVSQPENSSGGRVHPKLPDYEALTAQFAALKRQM